MREREKEENQYKNANSQRKNNEKMENQNEKENEKKYRIKENGKKRHVDREWPTFLPHQYPFLLNVIGDEASSLHVELSH